MQSLNHWFWIVMAVMFISNLVFILGTHDRIKGVAMGVSLTMNVIIVIMLFLHSNRKGDDDETAA